MLDADGKRYYEDIAEKIERMMFTKTIGPDNFYLQYDVKIGTYNDHGDGPNSTASIIWSAEGSKFVLTISILIDYAIWDSTRENLSSEVCEQHRCRPVCASAQSDQRLCYSLFGKYNI